MAHAPTQPDRLLKWMASLADATRLRLLALIAGQELGVSDLCEVVQLPQSTVSRHLKILADEGWVVSQRRGTTNLYQVVLDELAPAQRELWVVARDNSAGWPALGQDAVRLKRMLDAREQDAAAFFAGAAGEWDDIRHALYGRSFTRDAMLALLPPDWTVADLGCGSGALAADLARYVKQVVGVDNNAAMLKAARRRLKATKNTTLKRGELTNLPIDDDACDATLCVLVLTYLDDPAAAIAEMARVVKPGGRVVILDLLAHSRDGFRRQMGQVHAGFKPNTLKRMMRAAGLSGARCEPLPPEPDATGPALLLATGTMD
ncbi:metalloregulator ArsR/SmtB family transcription factor [Phycisphaeraceae bacterium D3-23]